MNEKYVNDHYDGKRSEGLENGARKHDFSTYTVDHYDSKPENKKGKKGGKKGDKKKDAGKGKKKGGVPPELAKSAAGKKGSKAQTEATPEIEGSATETISVA